jgi:hypothetical protein
MQQSIACEVVTLGKLMQSTEKFIIPPFQRNYAWNEKQYGAFWADLEQTFGKDGEDYFLGAIVLKPIAAETGQQRFMVIDGQQRIITTAIMLAALRHQLRSRNAHDCADRLEAHFLQSRSKGQDRVEPRLTLNVANRTTFEDYIYTFSDIKRIHDGKKGKLQSNTNALLLGCFAYMHKQITRIRHARGLSIEQLFDVIIKALEERITLISISVKDDARAYVLFETLNERGLELSQFDILKNYLLTKAEPEVNRAYETWNRIEMHLQNHSIGDFMRQYMSSFGKPVADRQLFPALKRTVRGHREALEYLGDLALAAKDYAALTDWQHPYWHAFPAEAQAVLRRAVLGLRAMGVQQPFVPLLAALAVGGQDEAKAESLARLFAMFEAFTMRYSTICSLPPNRLAAPYGRAAAFIRNEKVLDHAAIFGKFLAPLYPENDVFLAAFRTKTSEESALCRYILIRLNAHISPDGATAAITEDGVSLDHILPQNPSAEWLKARRHFRNGFKPFIHRLGNMTLLAPAQNHKLGNVSFSEKRAIFAREEMEITRRVAESERWTPREIDRRQRWMAGIAAEIWRCP